MSWYSNKLHKDCLTDRGHPRKMVNETLLCQLNRAKQAAQDTKRVAENMQDRLNVTMDSFEIEKNKTKELIQRAKDFLMGQSADHFASTLMETTSLFVFPS